jgi:amidase
MVPAAIGTQTVGSILRPAAYCGVVGCKGSFGSVPLEGVVPLSRALDHAGPIARSVADAALIEAVLTGTPIEIEPVDAPRIGVVRALVDRAESGLRDHLDGLVRDLNRAGALTTELELAAAFGGLAEAGRFLLETGAAVAHERWFAAHAAEYAPTIRDLVLAGHDASSDHALDAAVRVRNTARVAWSALAADVDVLLTPVAVSTAPTLAEGTGDGSLCAPWSTLGVPAISLPTGLDDAGLPFAVQLVGTVDDLAPLLGVAVWCERVIGFEGRPAT